MTDGSAPGICRRISPAICILERAYAVERQGAADRDPEVDEGLFADRAGAYLLDSDDAGNFGGDGRDFVGGTRRRNVGQRIDGASGRAASRQSRRAPPPPAPRRNPPTAARNARRPGQSARPGTTTGRMKNAAHRLRARGSTFFPRFATTRGRGKNQPRSIRRSRRRPTRWPRRHDPHARPGVWSASQITTPDRRNNSAVSASAENALDFAMPIVVFFVRRLAGNAHGDIGHHRGAEIDQRMPGFRQDGQRAGGKAHHRPSRWSAPPKPRSRKGRLVLFRSAYRAGVAYMAANFEVGRDSACHRVMGFPSAAAEHVTASRMRIFASSWSAVKRYGARPSTASAQASKFRRTVLIWS